jgi:type IV secretion system protein VirB5
MFKSRAYRGASSHTGHVDRQSSVPGSTVEERIAGQQAFFHLWGDLLRERQYWILATLASLAINGILVFAFIAVATKARITPYIVEVNRHGTPVAFGPAERIRTVDDRIVMGEISRFIVRLRTVTSDATILQSLFGEAYTYLSDRETAAKQYLDAYFAKNDPRVLARAYLRSVDVESVFRMPDSTQPKKGRSTWRIRWSERYLPVGIGGSEHEEEWEGFVTVKIDPPDDEERLRRNPVGIYITQLTWAQVKRRN